VDGLPQSVHLPEDGLGGPSYGILHNLLTRALPLARIVTVNTVLYIGRAKRPQYYLAMRAENP